MTTVTSSTYAEPSDEKLRELILYLALNSEGDPKFGRVKLNKLLFFCDFLAYKALGKPITGQEYQKLEFGPCPRAFVPICDKMIDDGDCAFRKGDHHGYTQHRLVALREPRPEVFSASEVDLIRDVIQELWNSNATEVSDLSHRFLGWELAEVGETIPYETILVTPPAPLSDEEAEWAREAVAEYLEGDQARA